MCDEIILDRENNKAKIIQRVGAVQWCGNESWTEKVDYKTVKSDIAKYAKALKLADNGLEEPIHMDKYKSVVETYLGKGRMVRDCEESQTDMMVLILEELEAYAKDNGITVQ